MRALSGWARPIRRCSRIRQIEARWRPSPPPRRQRRRAAARDVEESRHPVRRADPSGPGFAPIRRRVSTSTVVSPSRAGCSTSAISRLAMNRPVRTGVPPRVTSVTSTTPARGRHLDPAAGAARHDVEGLHGPAGIDHDLDPIALHSPSLSVSPP